MWWGYIIFTLLFFVGIKADAYDDGKIIKSFIKAKCLKNGGENAFEALTSTWSNTNFCLQNKIESTLNGQDLTNVLCTTVRSAHSYCSKVILEKLESCLGEGEKYLPDFLSGWLNAIYDAHCKNDEETFGKHEEDINEIFQIFAGSSSTCNFTINPYETVLETCFSKSTILKNLKDPDFVITMGSLCGYLEYGNQCIMGMAKKYCNEDIIGWIEFHLKPSETWCDKFRPSTKDN